LAGADLKRERQQDFVILSEAKDMGIA